MVKGGQPAEPLRVGAYMFLGEKPAVSTRLGVGRGGSLMVRTRVWEMGGRAAPAPAPAPCARDREGVLLSEVVGFLSSERAQRDSPDKEMREGGLLRLRFGDRHPGCHRKFLEKLGKRRELRLIDGAIQSLGVRGGWGGLGSSYRRAGGPPTVLGPDHPPGKQPDRRRCFSWDTQPLDPFQKGQKAEAPSSAARREDFAHSFPGIGASAFVPASETLRKCLSRPLFCSC